MFSGYSILGAFSEGGGIPCSGLWGRLPPKEVLFTLTMCERIAKFNRLGKNVSIWQKMSRNYNARLSSLGKKTYQKTVCVKGPISVKYMKNEWAETQRGAG